MSLKISQFQSVLYRALEGELYDSFDRELVTQRLSGFFHSADPTKIGQLIGKGQDFYALKDSAAAPYLYIVPHSERFRNLDGIFLRDWLNTFKKLIEASSPLVPPIILIKENDFFGLIMPFGETFVSFKNYSKTYVTVNDTTFPLTELIAYHNKILDRANISFDDLTQIRIRSGIPFVVDYGDIKLSRGR